MNLNRRKVAFVTNIIPHYRKSFYEKLCSCRDFEWTVVRGEKNVDDGRPDYKGHIDIPQTFVVNKDTALGPYTLRTQSSLLSQLRKISPDILIVLGIPGNFSTWIALVWAKLKGVKVVMWTCGWEPQADRSYALAVKNLLAKFFFSFPDRFFTYSTNARKYLIDLGVDADKITVCYNGIETDDLIRREEEITFKGLELRKNQGAENSFILLYVGGMTLEKRVDLLLDAFAELSKSNPDVHLWLVGDGPARAQFERQALELGLDKAKFWGQIVEDVDQFFSAADFFVLPGVGGLAFNQSMIWKTPCIATSADGTEDDLVIDGITGKRFEAGSLASISAAIKSCIHLDPFEKEKWGKNCRDLIVNRSNVNIMVQTFLETLKKL